MKIHDNKKPPNTGGYIKSCLCLALGLAVYIAYRVNDKAVIDALLIGGTAAIIIPLMVLTVRQILQGYREAPKE